MLARYWLGLGLVGLWGQALVVGCGSSNASRAVGGGGEAGSASDAGSGPGPAGSPGAIGGETGSGSGGSPFAPEGGAPMSEGGTGGTSSDAGASPMGGAGGEGPTLELLSGHCEGTTSCTSWLLPEQAHTLLLDDCEAAGFNVVSGCAPGYYGACVLEDEETGAFVRMHQYVVLGGPSVDELEPMTRASCESDGGVWVSENL